MRGHHPDESQQLEETIVSVCEGDDPLHVQNRWWFGSTGMSGQSWQLCWPSSAIGSPSRPVPCQRPPAGRRLLADTA